MQNFNPSPGISTPFFPIFSKYCTLRASKCSREHLYIIYSLGQLKLVVCGSDGRLSVTILEARSLPFRDAPDAQVWLEVHLLPGGDGDSKNRISHTSARVSASDPTFGETFTL